MAMLLPRLSVSGRVFSACRLRRTLHGLPPKEEYVAVAQYPDPNQPRYASKEVFERTKLEKSVRDLRTVEEKQYWVNKPKYYGWYSAQIRPEDMPYGALDFLQYSTWTHTVEGLPPVYESVKQQANEIADAILPKLTALLGKDLALQECGRYVPNDRLAGHETFAMPRGVEMHVDGRRNDSQRIRAIHRLIMGTVMRSQHGEHLADMQVDHDSRNEAFWFRAGFYPDIKMVKKREGLQRAQKNPMKRIYIKSGQTRTESTMTDEQVHAPYDRCMQYTGSAILQLRADKMISPFVDMDDATLCRQFKSIPQYRFDPRTLGFKCRPQLGTNTPGFWTASRSGFVSLSILHNQIQDDTQTRTSAHADQHSDRAGQLLSLAILGSFGVMLPEACHLGFGPFIDPSQPLATQTIVTDGQRWKLAVYQLNKTQLMAESTPESVNNVCWHLPEMQLFEHREATEDGRPAGVHVDRDVLSSIVAFYLMQPTEVVPAEAETLQDVRNNFNRESFFEAFRHMYSRAPRFMDRPHINAWQKVHMIDTKNWFGYGWRERPWFLMAKMDRQGREHWHPEFKAYDHYRGKGVPRKFLSPGDKKYQKHVAPPLPKDEHDQ